MYNLMIGLRDLTRPKMATLFVTPLNAKRLEIEGD